MSVPVCCKCNEVIRPRAICSMGKAYHPHHFTCRDCQKVMEPSRFYAVKDDVVCSECYLGNHASRCCACNAPIVGRAVMSMGRKWHDECFHCISCSQPLMSSTFYEINGYLFCKLHFQELFSSRCSGCGEPIVKEAVVALNTKWHAACFRCQNCQEIISSCEFGINESGRPLCLDCSPTASEGRLSHKTVG
ncbi:transforming growth factor beta-1-induced transcript 1 protein [Drosophila bipectinata]|uniref:transforming growth factor beta-1-induced transcript 1 protein n=1 Tax=Drosophila bipectinata TaxID=42026 RepID=UPI001C8AD7CC|nr:transforming growth factor beta-1-induced transcript 1 protein [Drosophila bipectinata]